MNRHTEYACGILDFIAATLRVRPNKAVKNEAILSWGKKRPAQHLFKRSISSSVGPDFVNTRRAGGPLAAWRRFPFGGRTEFPAAADDVISAKERERGRERNFVGRSEGSLLLQISISAGLPAKAVSECTASAIAVRTSASVRQRSTAREGKTLRPFLPSSKFGKKVV